MALMPRLLQHPQVGGKTGDPQQAGGGVGYPLQSLRVCRVSPAIHAMAPKSTSPLRVPIISPSSGVIPIEVSTLRPLRTAQIEAPLPGVGDHQAALLLRQPEQRRGRAGTHSGARCRGNRSGVPRDSGNTPTADHREKLPGPGVW